MCCRNITPFSVFIYMFNSYIFKTNPPPNVPKIASIVEWQTCVLFRFKWHLTCLIVPTLAVRGRCDGVSVYCRHVTVIAETIKCRRTDSCSGLFIKWWSETGSWKDEANRRGCKSAEEGSAEVDETFLGRLPPGSAGPLCPFTHSSVFHAGKLLHAFVPHKTSSRVFFYYLTVLRRLLIQFYSTLQCQVTTRYLSTQVWTKLIKETTETTTKEKTASKKSWKSKTYFNRQKPSTDPRIFGFTEKCTNKTRSLDPWF